LGVRLRRALEALRRFHRETLYLQERRLDWPWDDDGPLRWLAGPGGGRLVGSHLPASDDELSAD
jgi:hypothetical protein